MQIRRMIPAGCSDPLALDRLSRRMIEFENLQPIGQVGMSIGKCVQPSSQDDVLAYALPDGFLQTVFSIARAGEGQRSTSKLRYSC